MRNELIELISKRRNWRKTAEMCLLRKEQDQVICFQTRRTHNQYDACFGNYPDCPAIGSLNPFLVSRSRCCGATAQPCWHPQSDPATRTLCPSQVRARRGDRFCRRAHRLCASAANRPGSAYYERLLPFAGAFMALFGRNRLPARSTLSRYLSALDQATVEAAHDALSRGSGGAKGLHFRRLACGIVWASSLWSWMWMEPDKPHGNGRCRTRSLCQIRIVVLTRWRLLAMGGASAQKCCVRGPPFCKLIRINGDLFWSRQWRLPRRIETGHPDHHLLRDRSFPSPLPDPGPPRRTLWQCRSFGRCPDRRPWSDRARAATMACWICQRSKRLLLIRPSR